MLASGVVAGIAAGIAFGGDWRRLATFTLRWWPLLVLASVLRLWTFFVPTTELAIYVAGLMGVGIVSAVNWRVAGAGLIAIGTFSNVLVVLANSGMPYDTNIAASVGAGPSNDTLHVVLDQDTRIPFLSDIIPFGLGRAVFSIGDLLIAFGGFLIPFIWLQEEADPRSQSVRSANFAFFWLAQVISRFGDPITLIALTFVTYRATQSALLTALAVGVASIPNALFGFFGGAIADAFGPRRAMFWCDLFRAVIIGAIPVLLMFDAPLAFIFALAFLAGIGGAIFAPARGAVVPALLRRDHLAQGNSLVFASDRAVEIGGALAGGHFMMEESPRELATWLRPFLTNAFRQELEPPIEGERMTTSKQRSAARRNIKKAARAAKRKRTVAHLPKQTRTALGREGAKAAARKRRVGR